MKNFRVTASLFLAVFIGVTLNSCENERQKNEVHRIKYTDSSSPLGDYSDFEVKLFDFDTDNDVEDINNEDVFVK